jgi:hypothetical protein
VATLVFAATSAPARIVGRGQCLWYLTHGVKARGDFVKGSGGLVQPCRDKFSLPHFGMGVGLALIFG